MARTLSATFRAALAAQETEEVPIVLITITHADLDTPLRLSSDPTQRLTDNGSPPTELDPPVYGTQSRGTDYLFLPMGIVLPDDREDAAPAARLEIDNIGRETIALLRSTTDPALVHMEIVLASALDTVEIDLPELDLVSADYNINTVSVNLAINPLVTEPYPAHRFTPAGFPALFS